MQYTKEELEQIFGVKATSKASKCNVIQYISIDSRLISEFKSTLFFALKGSQKNGHLYISDAYNKGVRAFVIDEPIAISNYPEAFFFLVKNTLTSLQTLATHHRALFPISTIGITGSNGKTIVKEWLFECLKENHTIIRNPKSYNSQIGVPLSILGIEKQHNLGIFEAGISQPDEMQYLEPIIQPTQGIFTHLGTAHSENFTHQEALFSQKMQLFKNTSLLILPLSKPWILEKAKKICPTTRIVTWGVSDQANYCVKNYHKEETKTTLTLVNNSQPFVFEVNFTNNALLENCISVIVWMLENGYSKEYISTKIALLEPLKMRLELVEGLHDSILISDVYNSDLDSVKIALNMLSHQPYPNKSLVLTDFDSYSDSIIQYIKKIPLVHFIWIGRKNPSIEHLAQNTYQYESTEEFLTQFDPKNFYQHAVLFKGARKYRLEKAIKKMMNKTHETVFEINLENLTHNLNFFKSKLKEKTKMMVMVKASSYGSGVYEVASLLKFHQVDYLGVAYPDEGIQLRDYGIQMPIMVMNANPASFEAMVNKNLEPEIFSMSILKQFIHFAQKKQLSHYPIHIKIDTGMHRLGFEKEDIESLIELMQLNQSFIKVQSIFSHLATADVPKEKAFVLQQIDTFETIYTQITTSLGYQPIKHILNSSGISHFTEYQFDMVRLGIGLYGHNFDPTIQKHLKPIGKLKSIISQIKTLQPGETLGYSRNYTATKLTKTATIPIGYADGISRLQGNERGYVMINNQKAPIIGNVCMDMLMVDITPINCSEGSEVILLGEKPSLEEVAEWQQTIPYEVLTSIAQRVKRIYYS